MKNKTSVEEIRNRKFTGILYPDCERHIPIIEWLKKNKYNSIAILHDRDVYEIGDLVGQNKKAHYHFIVDFKNARYLTGVAKEMGLELYELEPVDNYRSCLRYLIHLDHPNKAQYIDTECFGSLYKDFLKAIENLSEDDKIIKIIDFIESQKEIMTTSKLIRWCCNNNCYDVCRRSATFIRDVLRERNEYIRIMNHLHN